MAGLEGLGGLQARGPHQALPSEQRDDLSLQQGGVGIHDDEVLGSAVQAGHLDRQVHLALGGLPGQGAPESAGGEGKPGTQLSDEQEPADDGD